MSVGGGVTGALCPPRWVEPVVGQLLAYLPDQAQGAAGTLPLPPAHLAGIHVSPLGLLPGGPWLEHTMGDCEAGWARHRGVGVEEPLHPRERHLQRFRLPDRQRGQTAQRSATT